MVIRTLNCGPRRFLAPDKVYASGPTVFFRRSGAPAMIAASKPIPAMIKKMCSSGRSRPPERSTVSRPTSIRLFWPFSATVRAWSRESIGKLRLRANRFAVPPGRRPMGVSVPTSAAATARTVPSPPNGQTSAAPSRTACRAWPVPGSWAVVWTHSGSAQPAARQLLVTCARTEPRSPNLVGLTMMAATRLGASGFCAPSGRKCSRGGRSRPKRRTPTAWDMVSPEAE